jgi:XRE family transcriptional regulator, regulator of sulfur utilization
MAIVGGKEPRHPKEPVVRAAFARALAELRKQAKMRQGRVGELSGYEEKYIGALERRKHTPTLTAVIEISKALNASPVEMVARVMELMPRFAHLDTRSR